MNVAIIGLGAMGLNHAENLRKLEFVTEVVGCDLSEQMRGRAEGLVHVLCDRTGSVPRDADLAIEGGSDGAG